MPVTIDITQDLRYQQGVEKGRLEKEFEKEIEKIVIAEKLLKERLTVSFVQKITGLTLDKVEELSQGLSKK